MPNEMRSGTLVFRVESAVTRVLPALVRIGLGLMWLSNVSWKVPTKFAALHRFVEHGVQTPVAPVYPWVLENLILPQITVFGYATLVVETALAALLLSGTFTRAAAVLGLLQSIAIGLSVANASGEWYWSYGLMALCHIAVFAMAAGRVWGCDCIIRLARPQRPAWLEAIT